ncbi:hypothetical protein BC829DRAFT_444702 [Chytridium lagenaria]|nr:hypothetical protein BC829DRAFT_444702 [Chytridium lagenaria]
MKSRGRGNVDTTFVNVVEGCTHRHRATRIETGSARTGMGATKTRDVMTRTRVVAVSVTVFVDVGVKVGTVTNPIPKPTTI